MLKRFRRSVREVGVGQAALYEVCWSALWVIQTLWLRLRRFNLQGVPRDGPCLMVANHQSYLDPTCVGMVATVRPMHPVARLGLFSNRAFGWLLKSLNSIPIREDEGDTGAIRTILARLGEGALVLIFPEGSRTPDGEMKGFKRGVAVLVKRSTCPVLPVAIEGAYDAWPRNSKRPRWWGNRVGVMVGRPIPHDELMRNGPDEAMRRLEREVGALQAELRTRLASAGRRRSGLDRGLARPRPR